MILIYQFLYINLFKTSILFNLSGESGIRTRDTLLAYTRFPGVPLQPLEHLSLFSNKETDNGNIFSTKEIAA